MKWCLNLFNSSRPVWVLWINLLHLHLIWPIVLHVVGSWVPVGEFLSSLGFDVDSWSYFPPVDTCLAGWASTADLSFSGWCRRVLRAPTEVNSIALRLISYRLINTSTCYQSLLLSLLLLDCFLSLLKRVLEFLNKAEASEFYDVIRCLYTRLKTCIRHPYGGW